jgi:hypothetical protein
MNEQKIIIDREGKAFLEETTRTPVTGVSKLMTSLAGSMAVRLPVLAPDLFLVYSGNEFTSFKLITTLTLHCTWTSDEVVEGKKSVPFLYPSFGRGVEGVSMESKGYAWQVPKDMALFFIVTGIKDQGHKLMDPEQTDWRYRLRPEGAQFTKAGLVAVDLLTGTLHRLPLPNVYDNATLCTGDVRSTPEYPMTNAEGIFGSWELNRWNADLHEYTKGNYKNLVRLDPTSGNTIAPVGGDWRKWCPKVSTGGWLNNTVLDLALEGITKGE